MNLNLSAIAVRERAVTLFFILLLDEWAVALRYMSLEMLARVTNTAIVRLPTVAA